MGKLQSYHQWALVRARRPAHELNRRKWLYLFVLLMTASYAALSLLRHWHFESGASDIGIFDQVVWHYSRFEAPLSTVRNNELGEHILGDHFHPILILLAPLYWFTSGAEPLLVVQSLLFALSIIPVYLFALKRLGNPAAWLFTISYAIFWGMQTGVVFEFHEIAFAVPLIAFAIYFIDEKKRTAYFICIGLLLLTKENLSVLVAFFGIYLIMLRQFKDGLISLTLGIAWFFAALKIFIPYFSGNGYDYWGYVQLGPTPSSALKTLILRPWYVIQVAISPAIKVRTLCYIFFPFLLLPFLSPLIVLTIPLLAERFLSAAPNYWGTNYHYTATISPVVAMAAIDALGRITRLIRTDTARRRVVWVACSSVLILNLYLLKSFPLWRLRHSAYWQFSESEKTGHALVDLIPPTASVAAQNNIVPHFSRREKIFLLTPLKPVPDCEYVITSKQLPPFPYDTHEQLDEYLTLKRSAGYIKVFEQDGWLVLYRSQP